MNRETVFFLSKQSECGEEVTSVKFGTWINENNIFYEMLLQNLLLAERDVGNPFLKKNSSNKNNGMTID